MEKGYTIEVLDKGYCRYIDHIGSDLTIVEAARISYKSPSKGEEQDKKLLEYLYKNLHSSPFEQCNITFNIKMPIFCMRQFVRHRTFRLNEWSGRYSELADDFYIPEVWRKQDIKNKQGSLETEDFNNKGYDLIADDGRIIGHSTQSKNTDFTEMLIRGCKEAYSKYKYMLAHGASKEMARMILPVNLYTEIYVNCDVRNLMHFFKLRLDPHAQWEIRQYAQAMYDIFAELYPWCAQAYEKFKFELVEV